MTRRPNRLLTDAFREIRRTMSRFLSLFLLSALAVAFLAGLRTTAPDMERSADAYYDAHSLMDLRVLSTLGLTEEDVSVLAAQPGISAAEGSYTVDALVSLGQNDLIVKLLSLSEKGINAPELLSGRLPETSRECLVEPSLLEKAGLSLGDSITFDTGSGDFADALACNTFTVVGTVSSPLYVSVDRGSSSLGTGKVSAFALLPREGFRMDYYTEAYLLAGGLSELYCYDDPYQDAVDALIDALEPLSDRRAALRYDEVVDEATEALDDAQREFDDAEAEADEELSDAQQELADARAELDDGWAEYRDGQDTLARETADAQRKITDAEAELRDALSDLTQGEADYTDGLQDLEEGRADYADGLKTWQDGRAEYEDGLQAWLDGKAEYDDGLKAWQDGKAEYDDGYADLVDGEAEYAENLDTLNDAQAEYDEGWQSYRDGLALLQNGGGRLMYAQRELDQAKRKLDSGSASLSAGREELEQGRAEYEAQKAAFDAQVSALNAVLSPLLGQELTNDQLLDQMASLLAQPDAIPSIYALLQYYVSTLPPCPDPAADPEGYAAWMAAYGPLVSLLPESAEALEAMLRQLVEGRAALDAAARELEEGQAQLDSGSSALASGRAQYSAAKREYKEGLEEFEASVAGLQDAYAELMDAKAELSDGWRQLSDGRQELDDGWAELSDAKRELDDGWAELSDAKRELDDGWAELTDAKQELDDGEAELETAAQDIADGEAELTDARAELDDGWVEYRDGLQALADAKATLASETADAERELADAYAELTDGEAEYADGLKEYEEGAAEADEKLSDARRELNDARRKVSEIENCKWYVLGRNANMGYVSFQQDAQRMGNLAGVFPIIFFLVAALVCLTTMTRMVEEQRIQIGCLKALGYSKGAIALKYVGYGFLASFTGGVVGLVLGCAGIPWIIFNAWKVLYTVGDLLLPVYPGVSILSVAAAVLCVTGTAFAASFAALSAVPAELMRPRAPKPGKRVFLERLGPLWRRLGFTWKVTVRNLFRYQKRFWMTVIGIGGCTALIVTGFGLRDSIFDILDKQFDEISTYQSQIGLQDDVTGDELTELYRALDRDPAVTAYLPCRSVSLSVEGPGRAMDAYLFVVEDETAFGDFIHLRHRSDHAAVPLSHQGAVITEKLSELLDVGVGDTVTLDGDARVEVPVVDIVENYVYHYVYFSSDYYEALFGKAPETNLVLARYADDTEETAGAVAASLIPLSGVTSVGRIRDSRDTFSKSMESVDYAVVLIICCAAALAFVVLYNLTNINITERKRELATLKVLGFYPGELSAYVYRENIFLTVFGVLAGLVMGKLLHQWLVLTVEIDMVMFGRSARPMSYVYAVVLTVLFSLLVNLAARRRLQKIDMVESLKTVD